LNKKAFFKLGSIAQLAKLVHRSSSTIYRWKREGIPTKAKPIVEKIFKPKKSKIKKPVFKEIIPKFQPPIISLKQKKEITRKYKAAFTKIKEETLAEIGIKPTKQIPRQVLPGVVIIPLTKREKAQRAEQRRLALEEQTRLTNIREVEKEKRKRAKKAEEEKLEKEEKEKQKRLDEEYGAGTVYREITVRRNIAIADRLNLLRKLKKLTKKQKEQMIILEGWLLDAALRLEYYETGPIEFYDDIHNIDDLHTTYDEIFGY